MDMTKPRRSQSRQGADSFLTPFIPGLQNQNPRLGAQITVAGVPLLGRERRHLISFPKWDHARTQATCWSARSPTLEPRKRQRPLVAVPALLLKRARPTHCGEVHEISVRKTYINGALQDAIDGLRRSI
jgi:hypothetical protein